MPERQAIAVGYLDKGLKIVDLDLLLPKFKSVSASFLPHRSVKDVMELGFRSRILAVTYTNPQYFVIDLEFNQTNELGNGFG